MHPLDSVLADATEAEMDALARRPDVPVPALLWLASRGVRFAWARLVRLSPMPADVFDFVFARAPTHVVEEMARSADMTESQLYAMNSTGKYDYAILSRKGRLPADIMAVLSESPCEQVRLDVAQRPDAPTAALNTLGRDKSRVVQEAARANLAARRLLALTRSALAVDFTAQQTPS